MKQSYLPSVGGRGIGAVAVHPSKQYICVAEVGGEGAPPSAYLYEYPSLRLYRVLRHGTERAYTAVCFNVLGDKVATVGAFPDFMLTVWDWKQELITLRSKAFAQEVFNVAFSPRTDGLLVTSGMVHIRFWKMARTFTGLKLQGEMGKFGTVEISDISGYIELPDGKVSSDSYSPQRAPTRAIAPARARARARARAPTLTLSPNSHPGDLDDGDRPAARVGGRPHQD
tara:strand:- start:1234 stop:1914 length:681 start_codon:yes stop_codon:yes gene_type:complete